MWRSIPLGTKARVFLLDGTRSLATVAALGVLSRSTVTVWGQAGKSACVTPACDDLAVITIEQSLANHPVSVTKAFVWILGQRTETNHSYYKTAT